MPRYCYVERGSAFWEGWYVNAESDAEALKLIALRYAQYFGISSELPPGAMFEISAKLAHPEYSSSRYLFAYNKSKPLKSLISI